MKRFGSTFLLLVLMGSLSMAGPSRKDGTFEAVQVASEFMKADASFDFRRMWALLDESIKVHFGNAGDLISVMDGSKVTLVKQDGEKSTTFTSRRTEDPDLIVVKYVYSSSKSGETRTCKYVLRRAGDSWRVAFADPSHIKYAFGSRY